MSTQLIYRAVATLARRELLPAVGGQMRHLDIGAGEGDLVRMLGAELGVDSYACDFHAERFRHPTIQCVRVDLDADALPYPDASFDLVTCSEVIEHLENPRALIREARRVLKPGGVLIVTTPNVLNARSRARYLVSGFANLFGPLPVKNDQRYTTGGHISPIAYFYLAHALLDSGFETIALSTDKVQKTSLVWLVLLGPLIGLGWLAFWMRENAKYRSITTQNDTHVRRHLAWPILVGRTLVVSARAPR